MRLDNLLKVSEKTADFERRLAALENKKSPIPIGLIAIWGKPSSQAIPEGWQECRDLRGKFALGWNPDHEVFREYLSQGGEETHQLTIEELPSHKHDFIWYSGDEKVGSRGQRNGVSKQFNRNDAYNKSTTSTGGNQAHNNMPPYRIIKYIEFIGYN